MKEVKLVPMVDFVLEHEKDRELTYANHSQLCVGYANFLKQPLELGFFVPCDLEGNVLEMPTQSKCMADTYNSPNLCEDLVTSECACFMFRQAKERVLFEVENGYDIVGDIGDALGDNTELEDLTIEDVINIISYEITLTKQAQKKIGL